MRYKFEAVKKVDYGLGDRHFANEIGDSLEVSAAWMQRIFDTKELADSYKLVSEVPENKDEEAQIARREATAKLMGQPKEKLIKKAEKLGVDTGLNKQPLAEAIVEAQGE